MPTFAYWLPLGVLAVYSVFAIVWHAAMSRRLNEKERDTETTRGFAFSLAGVSMGLLTLIVLDEARTQPALGAAITFSGVSFFCYLSVALAQSYKQWVWLDLLCDTLTSAGGLCLVLALAGILTASGVGLRSLLIALAFAAWGIDWVVRLTLTGKVLAAEAKAPDEAAHQVAGKEWRNAEARRRVAEAKRRAAEAAQAAMLITEVNEAEAHEKSAGPPIRAVDFVRCPNDNTWFRRGGSCPGCGWHEKE